MEEQEKPFEGEEVVGGGHRSVRTVMGFIYSPIKSREERKSDVSEGVSTGLQGQMRGIVVAAVFLHNLFPPSGSLTRDRPAPLPTPFFLTCFSVLGV